jgi:hypothetical protein
MNDADSNGVKRGLLEVRTHVEAEREDRRYWWSRTPEERMAHQEALRELNYGSEALNQRLQGVLTVLETPAALSIW